MIVFATFWFVHDPKSMTYIGFSPMFIFPTGDYNRDIGLNAVAGNRYKFQEEVGFVKGFCVMPGHNAYFQVKPGGVFETNNDNATNPITGLRDTKSTAPIFELQSHLSYDVTKAFWTSFDYTLVTGGTDTFRFNDYVDPYSNAQRQTIGGTFAYNFAAGFQALIQYSWDIEVKNGYREQAFLFRLLYATDLGSLCGALTH